MAVNLKMPKKAVRIQDILDLAIDNTANNKTAGT